ncbi:hypothetical protein CALCODRAFT_482518 [Calocera cornea HHB12733]|uniref:Uncharacterized protein n=1 Tax=Calocera cornea HHB12733 TaxID=1353952 RepID=A0A165GMT8_9BASI|nr:hypothetical protein CALCODRAFT_482518 [Calocera cornea HHB12733]
MPQLTPTGVARKRPLSPSGHQSQEERPSKKPAIETPADEEMEQSRTSVQAGVDQAGVDQAGVDQAGVDQDGVDQVMDEIAIKEEDEDVLLSEGIWATPDWKARAAALSNDSFFKSFLVVDLLKRVGALEAQANGLQAENAMLKAELQKAHSDRKGKGRAGQ